MAAIYILDFEDIYTAIIEMLKIQSSDTTTIARIKRDINIAYEDVVSRHNWWWNRSLTTLQTVTKITTGTIAVTAGSATITFTSGPAATVATYRIKFTGFPEIYTVNAHIAATTTATLNVAFANATNSAIGYVLWKDYLQLPTDCKETFLVQHQQYDQPMEPLGLEDFRRMVATNPSKEGPPVYYTTDDFDSAGKRKLRYWPSVSSSKYNIDVDYIMAFSPLDTDGNEPIMPVHDRTVLFYYGAAAAWRRERNTEEANNYYQLGEKKLGEMASKLEDSRSSPVLRVGGGYLAQKRAQRRGSRRDD